MLALFLRWSLMTRTSGSGVWGSSTKRPAWKRLGRLMYEWLCLLSCLSPNIYFGADACEDRTPSPAYRTTSAVHPDLHAQLEEIFDYVRHQERMWRLENRIRGSGA